MKTIEEIHRENLQELVKEFGSTAAVCAKIGCSSSQYSQWMNGSENSGTGKPRGMRPGSCRRIENAVGKPSGWMDQPHTVAELAGNDPVFSAPLPDSMRLTIETARELRLLTVYRLANERQRLALDNFIDRMQVGLTDGARNEG